MDSWTVYELDSADKVAAIDAPPSRTIVGWTVWYQRELAAIAMCPAEDALFLAHPWWVSLSFKKADADFQ
jgi:hypothetical protein